MVKSIIGKVYKRWYYKKLFYIYIMALGSKSLTRVIEQKLQYALLNASTGAMDRRATNEDSSDTHNSMNYNTLVEGANILNHKKSMSLRLMRFFGLSVLICL